MNSSWIKLLILIVLVCSVIGLVIYQDYGTERARRCKALGGNYYLSGDVCIKIETKQIKIDLN